jgi:hypothetical protein
MPQYKLAQQTRARARERAKRIREVRASVLDRLSRHEDTLAIRNAMKFGAESEAI